MLLFVHWLFLLPNKEIPTVRSCYVLVLNCSYQYDVPRPLSNDLGIILFQKVDA